MQAGYCGDVIETRLAQVGIVLRREQGAVAQQDRTQKRLRPLRKAEGNTLLQRPSQLKRQIAQCALIPPLHRDVSPVIKQRIDAAGGESRDLAAADLCRVLKLDAARDALPRDKLQQCVFSVIDCLSMQSAVQDAHFDTRAIGCGHRIAAQLHHALVLRVIQRRIGRADKMCICAVIKQTQRKYRCDQRAARPPVAMQRNQDDRKACRAAACKRQDQRLRQNVLHSEDRGSKAQRKSCKLSHIDQNSEI